MNATPRPQGTADTAVPVNPHRRPGRAFAHSITGALGSGHPHRSDGRPPHTPRGARHPGHHGGLGTSPPVPGPSARGPLRLGLLPGLCALLFALITWQVVTHGPLRALDERAGRAVSGSALPGGAAHFLADLGNATVAVPVLALAMAVSALRATGTRRWWPPLCAALTMAAVPALVVPVKDAVGRPGPAAMAGVRDGFFPSGHAATAAVAYGAAALLFLLHRPGRVRALAMTSYAVVNAGVGVGLVRCGFHWPLDVLGSWCLSGVLLWGLALALSRPPRAGRRRVTRPPRASTAQGPPGP
ncbi:phosphatase PAP2 family protein [Streptomyces sp. NPDC051162]|uniref:phosphatase PAP2 family protein n=1 Tax=unclassified Streptomyces TaxID=2593676 RepID=UPI00343D156A